MPTEGFTNAAQTTVTSGGHTAPAAGTVETWTVNSSSSFPPAVTGRSQFHIWDTNTGLSYELMLVTNVSGTTWTVVRGAEGTTPVDHGATAFTIQQVVSAALFGSFPQGLGPGYALAHGVSGP